MMEILTSYWAERSLAHHSTGKDQTGESGTLAKILNLNIIMETYDKRKIISLDLVRENALDQSREVQVEASRP